MKYGHWTLNKPQLINQPISIVFEVPDFWPGKQIKSNMFFLIYPENYFLTDLISPRIYRSYKSVNVFIILFVDRRRSYSQFKQLLFPKLYNLLRDINVSLNCLLEKRLHLYNENKTIYHCTSIYDDNIQSIPIID